MHINGKGLQGVARRNKICIRESTHINMHFFSLQGTRIQVLHLHKNHVGRAHLSPKSGSFFPICVCVCEPIDLLKIKTAAEPFLLPGSAPATRAQRRYIALIRVKEVHYISTAPAKHPLYYFIILFFAHTILLLNTHKNVSHMHFKRAVRIIRSGLFVFFCIRQGMRTIHVLYTGAIF